jgi:hypothetical protein
MVKDFKATQSLSMDISNPRVPISLKLVASSSQKIFNRAKVFLADIKVFPELSPVVY